MAAAAPNRTRKRISFAPTLEEKKFAVNQPFGIMNFIGINEPNAVKPVRNNRNTRKTIQRIRPSNNRFAHPALAAMHLTPFEKELQQAERRRSMKAKENIPHMSRKKKEIRERYENFRYNVGQGLKQAAKEKNNFMFAKYLKKIQKQSEANATIARVYGNLEAEEARNAWLEPVVAAPAPEVAAAPVLLPKPRARPRGAGTRGGPLGATPAPRRRSRRN